MNSLTLPNDIVLIISFPTLIKHNIENHTYENSTPGKPQKCLPWSLKPQCFAAAFATEHRALKMFAPVLVLFFFLGGGGGGEGVGGPGALGSFRPTVLEPQTSLDL